VGAARVPDAVDAGIDQSPEGFAMKIRTITLALITSGIAALAGVGLYRAGVEQGIRRANGPASAASASTASATKPGDVDPATGKTILYWQDPMVPGRRFDQPGKSPFMDMQLVPVYAGEGKDEAGGVTISPRVQQNLGIRTAEVTRGTLTRRVEAVGSVAYNERDVAVVQARSNGFVERLFVRAPLDPVRRGQPLAELYVPDWVAAQEEYLSAKRIGRADANGFDGLVDAARQRMRLAGMSEDQIRRVEASGTVQARTTLVAPIGGVVTELAAREGMTVMAGAPLFRINGLSTVWVNAELPEGLAAQVRRGRAVKASAAALPGSVFDGKVSAILPEVNTVTRTIKARVELANPDGRLVPGMFASVDFAAGAASEGLLVPTEAIVATGKRNVVIVAEGEGRFTPVDVDVGAESDGRTEIRRGLHAGQKVVLSGQFLIDSEASLRGTATRMVNPAPPTAPATDAAIGKDEAHQDAAEAGHAHGVEPPTAAQPAARARGAEPPAAAQSTPPRAGADGTAAAAAHAHGAGDSGERR
jgi:membrane fusion protein, copper/silver efflux system